MFILPSCIIGDRNNKKKVQYKWFLNRLHIKHENNLTSLVTMAKVLLKRSIYKKK